jgi:hypothetical protein
MQAKFLHKLGTPFQKCHSNWPIFYKKHIFKNKSNIFRNNQAKYPYEYVKCSIFPETFQKQCLETDDLHTSSNNWVAKIGHCVFCAQSVFSATFPINLFPV